MTSWTWAAASCRGTSHVRNNTRRQDAFTCCVAGTAGDALIAVVSDGAGSASMGGEGASVACRRITSLAKKHFGGEAELPSDDTVREWINDARDRIFQAAEKREIKKREFASTLVLALSTGTETLVAHIGDGSIVFKPVDTDEWHVASWPSHGEYASTTFFLTDEPEPQIKFSRLTDSVSALALFSDGIENLALEISEQLPHQRFFEGIIRPLQASTASGRDSNLSIGLSKFLDSEKVNERTDDDKTLILAVRR